MSVLHPPEHGTLLWDLTERGVITPGQARDVGRECDRGATLTTSLALMTDERAVWHHLAQAAGKPFLNSHQDLQVFFTDLLDHQGALQHQLLPHRSRGRELQVVTYNPQRQDGAFPPALSGQLLRHAVVSPTVWRYLYDLAYPSCVTGTLDEAEAAALVSCLPLGVPHSVTPEQRAEILALTRGYRSIDLRRDPVEQGVRGLVSASMKVWTHAYPHHLEGGRLVVMMADPGDFAAIHRLRQQTQREIIPAVTTREVIDQLIHQDDLEGFGAQEG